MQAVALEEYQRGKKFDDKNLTGARNAATSPDVVFSKNDLLRA
ncbi:MAG: hypothetical protein ABIT08_13870 [Bacteroidia bacterium]